MAQHAHISPDEGDRVWLLGDLYTVRLTEAETGGDLALIQIDHDRGSSSPVHVHENESETFQILQGKLKFTVAGEETVAERGDTVHLPRGVPHKFELLSEGGRSLVTATPGGVGGFFLESGAPVEGDNAGSPPEGPPDLESLSEIAASYDIEILRP